MSVPVNLLKAIDFEGGDGAAALMFVLGVNAEAFRVRSQRSLRGISVRAIVFAVLLALYAFVGCWRWVADRFSGGAHRCGRAHGDDARTTSTFRARRDGPITLRASADLTLAQRRVATWFLNR